MGALADTARLIQKYPLTFLAASAAAAVALPVLSVSTSLALRPWAKRILGSALSVQKEAQRIAAESREAYADLLAEVVLESAPHVEETMAARGGAPAAPRPHRAEPAPAEALIAPAA
jgi:hypothetical protein